MKPLAACRHPAEKAGALPSELVVGTKSLLDMTAAVPELLAIDKEIGRPYRTNPVIFNSQAWSRRLELPWVIEHIGTAAGLRILDVGSGMSALPVFLSRHKASVVSIDVNTSRHHSRSDMTSVRAALPCLPFRRESFDVVSCVSVLEHLPGNLGKYMSELCRVARQKVILTFDLALGIQPRAGLSQVELNAMARMVGIAISRPHDLLTPSGVEEEMFGSNLGVCLLCLEKQGGAWPTLRMNLGEELLTFAHRSVRMFGQNKIRWEP